MEDGWKFQSNCVFGFKSEVFWLHVSEVVERDQRKWEIEDESLFAEHFALSSSLSDCLSPSLLLTCQKKPRPIAMETDSGYRYSRGVGWWHAFSSSSKGDFIPPYATCTLCLFHNLSLYPQTQWPNSMHCVETGAHIINTYYPPDFTQFTPSSNKFKCLIQPNTRSRTHARTNNTKSAKLNSTLKVHPAETRTRCFKNTPSANKYALAKHKQSQWASLITMLKLMHQDYSLTFSTGLNADVRAPVKGFRCNVACCNLVCTQRSLALLQNAHAPVRV